MLKYLAIIGMLAAVATSNGQPPKRFLPTFGDWDVAANWLPATIPNDSDRILIEAEKVCQITQQNAVCLSFDVDGTLKIIDKVLTVGSINGATTCNIRKGGSIQLLDNNTPATPTLLLIHDQTVIVAATYVDPGQQPAIRTLDNKPGTIKYADHPSDTFEIQGPLLMEGSLEILSNFISPSRTGNGNQDLSIRVPVDDIFYLGSEEDPDPNSTQNSYKWTGGGKILLDSHKSTIVGRRMNLNDCDAAVSVANGKFELRGYSDAKTISNATEMIVDIDGGLFDVRRDYLARHVRIDPGNSPEFVSRIIVSPGINCRFDPTP